MTVPFEEKPEDIERNPNKMLALDRTSMANERTFLAFIRTSLGLFATGVGLIKFIDHPSVQVLGWLFIPTAVLCFGLGLRRFIKTANLLKKILANEIQNNKS